MVNNKYPLQKTHYFTLFYFPADIADQRRKKLSRLFDLRTSAKSAGDENIFLYTFSKKPMVKKSHS